MTAAWTAVVMIDAGGLEHGIERHGELCAAVPDEKT
jgi:hypothetical protein